MTSLEDAAGREASRQFFTPFRSVGLQQAADRQQEAFILGAAWAADQLKDTGSEGSLESEAELEASRQFLTPFRDVEMEKAAERQQEAFILGAIWAAGWLEQNPQNNPNLSEQGTDITGGDAIQQRGTL